MIRLVGSSVFALLMGAAALAQGPRAVERASLDPQAGNIERGRAIVVGAFAAGSGKANVKPQAVACFRCHGIDGRGIRLPPSRGSPIKSTNTYTTR